MSSAGPSTSPHQSPTLSPTPGGRHYNVAIVGYGPVGATLAGLLARAGLSVRVYEKSLEVYPQPRAVGFDHDAMRLFQRIGVADALAPFVAPFRDGVYYGAQGQLIRHVRRIPPPYPLTWAPNYTCDQPGVESILRDALARMDNVQVALGQELVSFTQNAQGVELLTTDVAGNPCRESADYLVACDGASSPVRRKLGITLESMAYDEPWIVVDVIVNDDCLHLLPQHNVQYCQPERPSSFINCPGNHRRWEFMTLPGEADSGSVSEERLWKLLARWLKPDQARIWRAAAYRFHALIADQWRDGRVLLAGDSAHQTPPFLGQGMCQGLRDVGNLAWKLERVIRGQAPVSLLDTYMAERRPHVAQTTRLAKEFGRVISERDPQLAQARDARMLAKGEPEILYRQELIPGLSAGLISKHAPLAGGVFPQPLVRMHGTPAAKPLLLDDLTPMQWRLVLDSSAAPWADQLIPVASQNQLPIIGIADTPEFAQGYVLHVAETEGFLRQWCANQGCAGALVRPDGYIYGTFANVQEAASLLEEWASHPELKLHATPALSS